MEVTLNGKLIKYWVTFPEYNQSSCVDLGDMQIITESNKKMIEGCEDGLETGDPEEMNEEHQESSGERHRDRHGSTSPDRRKDRRDSASSGRHRDRHGSTSPDRRKERHVISNVETQKSADIGLEYAELTTISVEDLQKYVIDTSRDASTAVGKEYLWNKPTSYKRSLALKVDRFTARRKSRSRSPERKEIVILVNKQEDSNNNKNKDINEIPPVNSATSSNSGGSEQLRKLQEIYGNASKNSML